MRSSCVALAVVLSMAATGHAQAPDVPGGNGRLSGRILTSTSEPIGDATVLLGLNDTAVAFETRAWWVATSDRTGGYQFTGLPAGRFTLIAAKKGYVGWESIPQAAPAPMVVARPVPALALSTTAASVAIDLVPGSRASEVNVTLHRPASISGRAVRPDGSPAAGERVMVYAADASSAVASLRAGSLTDANGGYAFRDFRPGSYYLGLPQPGRLEDLDLSRLTPVTLAEGVSLRNVDVTVSGNGFSITGRVVDTAGQVPRMLQLDYGMPGATHRGLVSMFGPDGRFEIRDRGILPGPLTIIGRGENDDGPVIGLLTLTTIDGPNDVEVVVGKPGAVRGRVSLQRGVRLMPAAVRLTFVREGLTPLGALDTAIEVAPDGWLEAEDLIGEYQLRVDEPRQWAVKSVRRRGVRLANDRLVVRNAEIVDELEILIGPR